MRGCCCWHLLSVVLLSVGKRKCLPLLVCPLFDLFPTLAHFLCPIGSVVVVGVGKDGKELWGGVCSCIWVWSRRGGTSGCCCSCGFRPAGTEIVDGRVVKP